MTRGWVSSGLTCCGWLGRARDANLSERGLWEDSLKPVNGRIDLDGELWGWVAAGSVIADGSPCSHHEANGVQNGMTLEVNLFDKTWNSWLALRGRRCRENVR
jgi:hypothetical protein